jgi:HEAT repeat protein
MDQEPALRETVRAEATRALAGKSWRGLEQAALILGKLDHEASVKRMLELLDYPRPEVRLAAAAALRWIDNPETLAPLLAHAARVTDDTPALTTREAELMKAYGETLRKANNQISQGRTDELPRRVEARFLARAASDTDAELSQIYQLFAARRYAPAVPLLMRYVPKHSMIYSEARAAAIYALGYIFAGKPNPGLVAALASRATDNNPLDPESAGVRRFSMISIARIKDPAGLGSLRAVYTSGQEMLNLRVAARWSIMEMTGETLPEFPPTRVTESGWWLEPLK